MFRIGKLVWSKFKSPLNKEAGRSKRDQMKSNLSTKLTVNEEYMGAFRTKSYIEMWDRVHDQIQLETTSTPTQPSSSSALSEYFHEPREETLNDMSPSLNVHNLVTNYFEASLEAYNICELLLQSVHQTLTNYCGIKKVCDDLGQCEAIFKELDKFSLLQNPLSVISPVQFHEMHDGCISLLQKLTSKRKKTKRKLKLRRICKKLAGAGLIVSNTVLLVSLLVFIFHSMVGIAAAPGLVACLVGLLKKKRIKRVSKGLIKKSSSLQRLVEQLDLVAKGVYIMVNDFDTLSRMVMRLSDEVEHKKAIAGMCVYKNGKCEILKEVVKEFRFHESRFMEQLNELEQHIYLCCLTINRSRRLVLQKILDDQLHHNI